MLGSPLLVHAMLLANKMARTRAQQPCQLAENARGEEAASAGWSLAMELSSWPCSSRFRTRFCCACSCRLHNPTGPEVWQSSMQPVSVHRSPAWQMHSLGPDLDHVGCTASSNMPHSHLGSSGNTLRLLQRQLQHLRAHDLLRGRRHACILAHLQDTVCLLQAQLASGFGLPFASRT